MLDGINTGAHRGLDPFRAFSVRHHLFSRAVRHLHRFGHLLLAQLFDQVITDRIHHAPGGHQLDPVRTVLDVAPHCDAHAVDRIRDIGVARQLLVGRKNVGVAVSPIHRNEIAR